MEKFLIPTFKKIVKSEGGDPNKAVFKLEKLERGFGNTIGNSLRRVLLSSIPGAAPFAFKGKGIMHEFQAIKDCSEDVVELILNLKEIVLTVEEKLIDSEEIIELTLVSKSGVVKAGDISTPTGIKITNKNFVIANTSKDGALDLTIYVLYSKGYKTFEENRKLVEQDLGDQKGVISIDSNFSPVVNVKSKIEEVNPGEVKVYERLQLEVETKGNMLPEKAVSIAGGILKNYFAPFDEMEEDYEVDQLFEVEQEEEVIDEQLLLPIEELNLTTRSERWLKEANVNTVNELVDRTISELKKIENLGDKSISEIIDAIRDMGLSFKAE